MHGPCAEDVRRGADLEQGRLKLAVLVEHLLPLDGAAAGGLEEVGDLELNDALPNHARERGGLVAPQHQGLLRERGWAVLAPLADPAASFNVIHLESAAEC